MLLAERSFYLLVTKEVLVTHRKTLQVRSLCSIFAKLISWVSWQSNKMHRTYKAHLGLLRKEINPFSLEKNQVFTKRVRDWWCGGRQSLGMLAVLVCGSLTVAMQHPPLPVLGGLRWCSFFLIFFPLRLPSWNEEIVNYPEGVYEWANVKKNKVSSAKHGSQLGVYLSAILFGDLLWPHNCAGTMRRGIFSKFAIEDSSWSHS